MDWYVWVLKEYSKIVGSPRNYNMCYKMDMSKLSFWSLKVVGDVTLVLRNNEIKKKVINCTIH